MKDVNLKAMITIKQDFGTVVGYSDHTQGIEVPIAAVALGAQVIEKHFTLDRNSNPYSGEDVNYIESPYSHKSFVDFRDNMLSIENTLYGGREGDGRDLSKSIIQYMKDNN